MKPVRCAIYTRKSSEEGLEQGFNSLHAQREACAAYVLSQASERWTLLPDEYDDGGLSGGTLERPALQRLLADVAAGKVDIIVVYKVDRLTRSLLDFAKLVEALDKAGTSFVSITQSFNTTTSMGRLTLNMLLSFAQFEREVTAERIRDKLAASKAKGMWMGGIPPLGYKPNGRTLAIVEPHAVIVRDIFARYASLGTVRLVAEQLAGEGITSPRRKTGSGKSYGGAPFSRGALYAILRNPIYIGMIPHKDRHYPGNHKAIIEQAQWDAVQHQLDAQVRGKRTARQASPCRLAGRIVDAAGDPLIATHTRKGGTRYRYYVSKALHESTLADPSLGIRLPAAEIEQLAAHEVANLLDDPLGFAERTRVQVELGALSNFMARSKALACALRTSPSAPIPGFMTQVRILDERVEFDLCPRAAATALSLSVSSGSTSPITLAVSARLTRTGRAIRLVQGSGATVSATGPDPSLIRLVCKARAWWERIRAGEVSPSGIAAEEGCQITYVVRVLRLAFLGPSVLEAVLDGTLKADVDRSSLRSAADIPLAWSAQEAALLPG